MNGDHIEKEQAQLQDIVKRGIAVADANIVFIAVYFAISYLVWLGFERVGTLLLSADADASPNTGLRMTYILLFWVVQSSVPAFIDCIIAGLLRKQVLELPPDGDLPLAASLRKFYVRMLLLNAIHVMLFTLAPPLYPAVYVVLRYTAAVVIWRDCTVRVAFSCLSRFLSVHLDKFLPVWLVGTALLVGTQFASRLSASTSPVFMGLVHLVVAYFDFAVVATALVSFIMLQHKQEEVRA